MRAAFELHGLSDSEARDLARKRRDDARKRMHEARAEFEEWNAALNRMDRDYFNKRFTR